MPLSWPPALASAALALLLLASPAAAHRAQAPSARWPAGSPGMDAARSIAAEHWGQAPCGGHVSVRWGVEPRRFNAITSWSSPIPATNDPQDNDRCRIVFNSTEAFSWPKFCTVVAHEYGHLLGLGHTADGPGVMSAIYRAPLPACAATPGP